MAYQRAIARPGTRRESRRRCSVATRPHCCDVATPPRCRVMCHLRAGPRWGDMRPLLRGVAMPLLPVLLLSSFVVQTPVAQTPAPAGATPVWTARFSGDIRWQQVTPAGPLLVSTDGALAAVDIERGQIVWQKPELGGLPADSVRMVEGSLLMEAARPGLLLIFDPVTGTVLFDSRRLSLTRVVTRRVLPQTGTLLVHGQRQSGPPVV